MVFIWKPFYESIGHSQILTSVFEHGYSWPWFIRSFQNNVETAGFLLHAYVHWWNIHY